jgi:TolA-binding protein
LRTEKTAPRRAAEGNRHTCRTSRRRCERASPPPARPEPTARRPGTGRDPAASRNGRCRCADSAGPDQFLIARQQIDLRLYDQAIESLRKVAEGGDRQKAIEASFLTASIHDARGDTPNAMSTYIEIAHRFPEDSRAAEALVRLAEATLKSKRRDKEPDARKTLTEVVEKYPGSPWAPRLW